MFIRDLKDITNEKLLKAISLVPSTFKKLYIAPNAECALTFEGELSESDIVNFFKNMGFKKPVEYLVDYSYYRGTTDIYTLDGYNYYKD